MISCCQKDLLVLLLCNIFHELLWRQHILLVYSVTIYPSHDIHIVKFHIFQNLWMSNRDVYPMWILFSSYFPVAWSYLLLNSNVSFYILIFIFYRVVFKDFFSTNTSAISFLSVIFILLQITCLIGFLLVLPDIFRIMSRIFFVFVFKFILPTYFIHVFRLNYLIIGGTLAVFIYVQIFLGYSWIFLGLHGVLFFALSNHGLVDFAEADHFVGHFLRLQRRVLITYIMCSPLLIFASKIFLKFFPVTFRDSGYDIIFLCIWFNSTSVVLYFCWFPYCRITCSDFLPSEWKVSVIAELICWDLFHSALWWHVWLYKVLDITTACIFVFMFTFLWRMLLLRSIDDPPVALSDCFPTVCGKTQLNTNVCIEYGTEKDYILLPVAKVVVAKETTFSFNCPLDSGSQISFFFQT